MAELLCNWVRDSVTGKLVDMVRYQELLRSVPKHVADNLEKARLERDPERLRFVAGLGYEELLATVIVDGSAIASSSTEAFLVPALMLPANYLHPGGIPGRTLRLAARGRSTTLTTGATLIFKIGAALTNVIPTTTWCVSGAMVADATVQTATMWSVDAEIVVRSVGSAGTVFAMGEASWAAHSAFTAANAALRFMGSAGSATPAVATVDMTSNQFLGFTGKWSLATAYSIQCHQFLLEALN